MKKFNMDSLICCFKSKSGEIDELKDKPNSNRRGGAGSRWSSLAFGKTLPSLADMKPKTQEDKEIKQEKNLKPEPRKKGKRQIMSQSRRQNRGLMRRKKVKMSSHRNQRRKRRRRILSMGSLKIHNCFSYKFVDEDDRILIMYVFASILY
ncbi:hypothetical protein OWV82_012340 [Melia azedarach]|uniref:Uncharacterized protein n=1 Tax=Melia azedarach TaxID=155640 RepID=A0ACC1Y261_MELAZ|nr:hypothetical protein OWV82_012340 [Melia azedarach]